MNILQLIHTVIPVEYNVENFPQQVVFSLWDDEMQIKVITHHALYGTPDVVVLIDNIGDHLKVRQRNGDVATDDNMRALLMKHTQRWIAQQLAEHMVGVAGVSSVRVREIHRYHIQSKGTIIERPEGLIAGLQ